MWKYNIPEEYEKKLQKKQFEDTEAEQHKALVSKPSPQMLENPVNQQKNEPEKQEVSAVIGKH